MVRKLLTTFPTPLSPFVCLANLKAMLHEAIFLATCNVTMTNKKPFKLQRGCHTFATFFATCNAYNKQDGGHAKSPTSWDLIGPF